MLTNLSIKNYALIEHLDVPFQKGFTTITGETGAGKSILLGALGLVLGKRADTTHLNNSEKKCIIEAVFDISNYALQSFFKEQDLDYEDSTILRREILPSGKSRAFINDTPTTLAILSFLSQRLIDVHSQHQTTKIGDSDFHFELLDALASNKKYVLKFQEQLKTFKKETKALENLLDNQQLLKQQYDFNLHLYTELEQAKLIKGEQETIEEQLEILNNSEAIKSSLSEALQLAKTDDIGLESVLHSFKNSIKKIAAFSSEYQELSERIESTIIEFNDIVSTIENVSEAVNYNPQEITKLNDRLQLILNLQSKHGVQTIADLHAKEAALEKAVMLVDNASEVISAAKNNIAVIKDELNTLTAKITSNRQRVIPNLEKQLQKDFHALEMKNASCKFDMQTSSVFLKNGKDILNVLFSANKGVDYKPLHKVASGGEMSRIMLAIKNVLSKYSKLPTIILDEIDTGVSGEISKRIATIMQVMASNMQVITITHLAQVAAKGDHHYKVYKKVVADKTVTNLQMLNNQERVEEIATMIGGKQLTDAALEHAKELLN